eukprot:747629_1
MQRYCAFLTAVALLLLVPSIGAFSPTRNLVSVSFSKREDAASTGGTYSYTYTSLFARSDLDLDLDLTRRKALRSLPLLQVPLLLLSSFPASSLAKCTDIESCREAGERKMEQDAIDNPITKLPFGVKYKVLQPGTGDRIVAENDNIDLIFSVSRLGGGYMYSRGFGFEKIDGGNGKMISDAGLDSIRVQLGTREVPIGIQEALVGMKKGERRRVELPPNVGFATSNWQPEPTTKRGQATLAGYMYSRGFGFEKIDGGNGKMISDAGLDSIRVQLGTREVPIGIQEALVGMKKGERRRVELPPNVGFATSNWQPEPTTKRGQATLAGYKRVLEGNGTNQPPFPALSIWDVEVLRIRK